MKFLDNNRNLEYSLSTKKGIEKANSFWTPTIQKEYGNLKTEQDFEGVLKKLKDSNTYNDYKKAVAVEFLEQYGGFEDYMQKLSTKGVQYKN